MPRDPRFYLWDLEEAISDITAVIHGRSFVDYSTDRNLRRLVERNFEIIGEGLVRLARHFPVEIEQIEDYRDFIRFRNVIAHQYDGIDDIIVWQAANSLSALNQQVAAMRQILDVQGLL